MRSQTRRKIMKRKALAVSSGSLLAFLFDIGAAWGAALPDAHDRDAATLQQSSEVVLVDAHDRGGTLRLGVAQATLLPDGRALRARIDQLDAHSRSAGSLTTPHSSYQDAAYRTNAGSGTYPIATAAPAEIGFSWSAAFAGAGTALLAVAALGLLAVAMRHGRRSVALP
jgi:hypothetical protein